MPVTCGGKGNLKRLLVPPVPCRRGTVKRLPVRQRKEEPAKVSRSASAPLDGEPDKAPCHAAGEGT
eukprot:8994783-Pyramimonas_sp.AAC.1